MFETNEDVFGVKKKKGGYLGQLRLVNILVNIFVL